MLNAADCYAALRVWSQGDQSRSWTLTVLRCRHRGERRFVLFCARRTSDALKLVTTSMYYPRSPERHAFSSDRTTPKILFGEEFLSVALSKTIPRVCPTRLTSDIHGATSGLISTSSTARFPVHFFEPAQNASETRCELEQLNLSP